MGERAMYDRARRMRSAFENATAATRGAAGEGDAREKPAEWAKLDMAEFQEIEDYAGIKGIIEAKLRAHAVDSAWFVEPNIMQLNSNYLVTDPKGETLPRMGHMWRGDGRGSVPGWARRPRQQALLVRGRPPLRERRCP